MMVRLDEIEPTRGTRQDLVNTYVLMSLEHKRPPPVLLMKQDAGDRPYRIYDGHHRVAAARYRGQRRIKACIVEDPESSV